MEHYEMVEKLCQKANISMARAKEVLEKNNWDLLDAMIELENTGESAAEKTEYSTQDAQPSQAPQPVRNTASDKEPVSEMVKRFFVWCGKILKKGMENHLVVIRNKEQILSVPITILAILLLLGFRIIVPLMVVGLFFDCRYRVEGKELGKPVVNDTMEKVSEVAEEIKAKVADSN